MNFIQEVHWSGSFVPVGVFWVNMKFPKSSHFLCSPGTCIAQVTELHCSCFFVDSDKSEYACIMRETLLSQIAALSFRKCFLSQKQLYVFEQQSWLDCIHHAMPTAILYLLFLYVLICSLREFIHHLAVRVLTFDLISGVWAFLW